jgi:ABC-type sugar transport system substrate-binding protein
VKKTTFSKLGLSLVVIAIAIAAAVGCNRGGGGAAKIVKLAFVTNNPSQFWKIAAGGIHKYEAESKVQVDIKMPPNGTPEDQNQIMQNLVSQGYDAVAVSVIAPNDQVGVLNKVAEKTNLITFDSDAPKSNRLLYIGTNNYDAGKMLGQEIVKLLPSGGKLAVFVGMLSADNATQRLKGIQDAIAGHKIDIIDKREDNTDRAKARSNVEDIVNANADLSMVVGLWNYNGPAKRARCLPACSTRTTPRWPPSPTAPSRPRPSRSRSCSATSRASGCTTSRRRVRLPRDHCRRRGSSTPAWRSSRRTTWPTSRRSSKR